MVATTLLWPYWLATVHLMSLASFCKTGDMESMPASFTVNLSAGRAVPVEVVQEMMPGGKLSGVEQVRVTVVLVGKMVGWMEVATGEAGGREGGGGGEFSFLLLAFPCSCHSTKSLFSPDLQP